MSTSFYASLVVGVPAQNYITVVGEHIPVTRYDNITGKPYIVKGYKETFYFLNEIFLNFLDLENYLKDNGLELLGDNTVIEDCVIGLEVCSVPGGPETTTISELEEKIKECTSLLEKINIKASPEIELVSYVSY